jgi:hypothetical protein
MLEALVEGWDVFVTAGPLVAMLVVFFSIVLGAIIISLALSAIRKTPSPVVTAVRWNNNTPIQVVAALLIGIVFGPNFLLLHTGILVLVVGPLGALFLVCGGMLLSAWGIVQFTYKRFRVFAVIYSIITLLYICTTIYLMIPDITYV